MTFHYYLKTSDPINSDQKTQTQKLRPTKKVGLQEKKNRKSIFPNCPVLRWCPT
jgi:hypothetical protein